MGKQQMRMNIHIDGDSRGFKRSLTSTQRDLQQFRKQAGSTMGRVVDIAGLGMLSRYTGLLRTGGNRPGMLRQLGSAASLTAQSFASHRMMKRAEAQGRERARGRFLDRSGAQGQAAGRALAGAAIAALPLVLGAGAVGAAVAALSVRTAMANQRRLNEAATQYSAPVALMQARMDVFEQRMAMLRASDPAYIEQQKELMVAKGSRMMAGTQLSGRDLTTTAEIWWNKLVTAVTDVVTGQPSLMGPIREQAMGAVVEGGIK